MRRNLSLGNNNLKKEKIETKNLISRLDNLLVNEPSSKRSLNVLLNDEQRKNS